MSDLADCLLSHWLQTLCGSLCGQFVKFIKFGLSGVSRPKRESHIHQLLRVQITMPVLSSAPRSRQGGSRGIYRLPLVAQVDTSCDLPDQNWSQAHAANFLVHTKEVYFCHLDANPIDYQRNWDGSDEASKLSFATNTDDPVWDIAWWVESPSEEVN